MKFTRLKNKIHNYLVKALNKIFDEEILFSYGIVNIYKEGKLLISKNEQITKDGLLNIWEDTYEESPNLRIRKILHSYNIGTGTTPASFDDTDLEAPIFLNPIEFDYYIYDEDFTNQDNYWTSITAVANLISKKTFTISEFGIYSYFFFSDLWGKTSYQYKLFDRAVFSPIRLEPNKKYTFTFTLLFSTNAQESAQVEYTLTDNIEAVLPPPLPHQLPQSPPPSLYFDEDHANSNWNGSWSVGLTWGMGGSRGKNESSGASYPY